MDEFVVKVLFYDSILMFVEHASFGNNIYCNMGNETGGYSVRLDGDLEYNSLYSIITNGEKMKDNELFFDYSILGPNVLIENCSLLDSVIIGEHAHILSSYIKNCSVLSTNHCTTLYFFIYLLNNS